MDRHGSNQSNRTMLIKLSVIACVMFGFGFAMVPLYKKYCEATGAYNLQRPDRPRNTQVDEARTLTVQFDANTRNLPWEFRPLMPSVRVHPGQMVQVVFEVKNDSDSAIVGQAVPSYGPQLAAQYVKKIECFCFARQEVKAGETRQMPVQFVVDPRLPAEVSTITLSYTFFELPGASGG
jgi:cytochrome c oxidase assembly protein subunit 11